MCAACVPLPLFARRASKSPTVSPLPPFSSPDATFLSAFFCHVIAPPPPPIFIASFRSFKKIGQSLAAGGAAAKATASIVSAPYSKQSRPFSCVYLFSLLLLVLLSLSSSFFAVRSYVRRRRREAPLTTD